MNVLQTVPTRWSPPTPALAHLAGKLIVVEGLDGSGKSSLAAELASRLGCVLESTPSRAVRQSIRPQLDLLVGSGGPARQLLYASLTVAAMTDLQGLLDAGWPVVLDRYWPSTWAYAQLDQPLDLRDVEQKLRPADWTIWVDAADDVRLARMALRGALDGVDERSVQQSAALREQYALVLARPIAGQVLHLNTSAVDVSIGAAQILTALLPDA